MPIFVKILDESNKGQLGDALVIPANIYHMEPHTVLGKAILEEAGDQLTRILSKNKYVNTSFITKSFKSEESRGIKHLIHSVILFNMSDEAELKKSLSLYYQNSLKAALNNKILKIAIPIISRTDTIKIDEMFATKIAHEEVNLFSQTNPNVEINLICEDDNILQTYQWFNDSPTSDTNPQIIASPTISQQSTDTIIEEYKEEVVKPNSPKQTEEELLNEQIKGNLALKDMPESLLYWHRLSSKKMKEVISEEKHEMIVKCFLGPNLSSIKARYDKGKAGDLQWRHYRYVRKAKLLQRAIDGMQHHQDYLGYYYKLIFNYASLVRHKDDQYNGYQMMDSFLASSTSLEKFTAWKNKKIHKNWIDASCSSYKDFISYVRKHFNWLQSSELGRERLARALVNYIFCIFYVKVEFPDKLEEQVLEIYKKELTTIINANIADWYELKCLLKNHLAEANAMVKSVEAEADLLFEKMLDEQKKEIIDYVPCAVEAFKEDDSSETVASINQKIINIVNYSNLASFVTRDNDLVSDCYNSSRSKNITTMLDERYLKKEFHSLVAAIQDINKIGAIYSGDQSSILIKPLDWSELSSFLTKITCKSELQHIFRLKLEEYIANRTNPSIYQYYFVESFYKTESLSEGKRLVSYLIGCLFLASAYEVDCGILFNKKILEHTSSQLLVGIELVIQELDKYQIKSSQLRLMLANLLIEIKKDSYIFFDDSESTKKENMYLKITDESELFQNAIKNNPSVLPTSKQQPQQYENLTSLGLFGCGNFRVIDSGIEGLETYKKITRCSNAVRK